MRFRRKSARAALDALDEAAKLRHDLRLRWLDEAERTQSQAASPEPGPSGYDPDYRSRRPYIGKEPQTVSADVWSPWITDAAMTRMAKAIINLTPDFYTPQERTTMNDEIKVGDTVESDSYQGSKATVIAVDAGWLWLNWGAGGSHFTERAALWRKVKTPTPCPEAWMNVYPTSIALECPTRESADGHAALNRIGVLHLSPNGDCEFIRTEEP